jgi:hypothetical protein
LPSVGGGLMVLVMTPPKQAANVIIYHHLAPNCRFSITVPLIAETMCLRHHDGNDLDQ